MQKIRNDNTSGFKGVVWSKERKKWEAQISYFERHINIGRYKDKIDAVLAYNQKAIELFGEFARINKI